jgi:hypothetical protein
MTERRNETILLVCDCEHSTTDILDKLYLGGFSVVGPVPNARMALLMAAQTVPTIAVVASPPNGRRNAAELANDLMRTWGIRSWVLERAEVAGTSPDAVWAADDDRLGHIRRALQPDGENGRAI